MRESVVGKEEKERKRKIGGWEGSRVLIIAVNIMHPDGEQLLIQTIY